MVTGMKSGSADHRCVSTVSGHWLAQLLLRTQAEFMRVLELEQHSQCYLRQSQYIIQEYAQFCESEGPGDPWQLRQKYLRNRAALRSKHRFSESYLEEHGRQLGYFLRWYRRQLAAQRVSVGELSAKQLRAYWRTQRRVLPYRRRILSAHLDALLRWVERRPEVARTGEIGALLDDYFEQRRRTMRGEGYGFVLTHRAQSVTRRHLVWLEQHGHLPSGTAAPDSGALGTQRAEDDPQTLLEHFVAKVDGQLPEGLRQPLIEYLQELVYGRGLVKSSLESIVRTSLALCRWLADSGHECFAQLRSAQLDQVVWSLTGALSDQGDLRRRRQQIRAHHSRLRGLLRHLQRRGLLGRDLARVLISPPCYRASNPPTVLSEHEVASLLGSVDRSNTEGRRAYAILVVMTTYGLRPGDVARLALDDLHWRQGHVALVQKKTGRELKLPLLPDVILALSEYLREDRLAGLPHRRVFVSLSWPHRSLRAASICRIATEALREAGLSWACAKHLRSTVATHLLRQGEALSTIQEVLGHCTAETTQRYVVTDVVLLRQVLKESER